MNPFIEAFISEMMDEIKDGTTVPYCREWMEKFILANKDELAKRAEQKLSGKIL